MMGELSRFSKAILVSVLLISPPSWSAMRAMALGVSVPQVMGASWQDFSAGMGAKLETWSDLPDLSKGIDLHLQADYQQYSIRNTDYGHFSVTSAMLGLQLKGSAEPARYSVFMGIDLGAAYELLWLKAASSGNYTGSFAFLSQLTPGVDVTLYRGIGLVFEMPVRLLVQKSTLATWESSFSLRWSL